MNSSENSKVNSSNLANLSVNSVNSNTNSNFKAKLKAIFALPKWAKVFLAVLSVVAVAGLITAFSLKSWAADKVESGQLVLNGIDKGWQGRLLQDENYTADEIKAFLKSLDTQKATQDNADENLSQKQIVPSKFAFDGRLYFQRLDFLLRSKVIAYIDIQGISWGENIDKNAVSEVKSRNRHIRFITSQDLQGLNAQNIGKVEYKMDFSPLFKTIIKYYLIISLCLLGVLFLRNFLWLSERGEISFATQTSLPSVLWQGYKSINPLYRHTFWIVFIAMNLVFGFHTVQFLWGNHDWAAAYRHIGFYTYFGMGRYTQNIIHFS